MVTERPAEQEFHGHIVNLLCVLLSDLLFEVDTRLRKQVAHAHTRGAVNLRFAGVLGFYAEKVCQQGNNLVFEFFGCNVEC